MTHRTICRLQSSRKLPTTGRNKFFVLVFLFSSCSPDRVDDPIPFLPFNDIEINLSLPTYLSLSTDGGFVDINGGVQGIILYRKNSGTYLAFERNCSFQPNDACALVVAQPFFMRDACCGSTFNYDGNPTGGLAWRPLQQYKTSLSSNTVTITDEVL